MPYNGKDKDKRKKIRRLEDVDVTHVSLVDRPATRVPFKFIKRDETQEKGVIMHHSLKQLIGKRSTEVASVIAANEAQATALAKMLIDGDFTVAEEDGTFVARKNGLSASDDDTAVYLGKAAGVAYTLTNVAKELVLYDPDNMTFSENVQTEGFVPSLYVGMEALQETIRKIAMSEDTSDKATMQSKVSNALREFSGYVEGLIDGLPERAFKFEKALAVVSAKDFVRGNPEDGFQSEVYDAIFGAPEVTEMPEDGQEAPAQADAPAAKDGGEAASPAAEAVKEGEAADAGSEGEDGAEAEAGAAGADADAAPANLEELPNPTGEKRPSADAVVAQAMEDLTKTMTGQFATMTKALNERMDTQDKRIEGLTKKVGNSVASTPDADPDDGAEVVPLRNSRGGGEPPLLDTAFMKAGNEG